MANLMDLQPNKVSMDLTQYSMVWIGNSGEGKTFTLKEYLESLSTDGRKPLFLMFEDRYQNIPNIMAIKINNVAELKSTISQLKNPLLKEKFSCLVIDTVDKFEELAEQYVTDGHDVAILADVGTYGKGTQYFKKILRAIGDLRNLGYPVHFVAQSVPGQDSDGTKKIDMKLSKNSLSYIKEGAYLVGFMWKELIEGKEERFVTFSSSPMLPNLKDTFNLPIKINTKDLRATVETAIGGLGEENITAKTTIVQYQEETTFEFIKSRGSELGGILANNGYLEEAMTVLKRNLGLEEDGVTPKLFDGLKETQLDLAKVVVFELEELVIKYKLQ